MASQYAGWELKGNKFFAMGSGPMRAAACRETTFPTHRPLRETDVSALVYWKPANSRQIDVCVYIAEKCGISTQNLTLLVARTASPAGTFKLLLEVSKRRYINCYDLGFDLNRSVEERDSRTSAADLRKTTCTAIGWTNDAILYGAVVRLYVHGEDRETAKTACPSSCIHQITVARSKRSSNVTTAIFIASIHSCSAPRYRQLKIFEHGNK